MRAILAPPTVSLLLITATDTLAHGGGRSSFWTGGSHRSITPTAKARLNALPVSGTATGAWIEQCSYPIEEGGKLATVTGPSAQLGFIRGNDARLYQIRVPA